MNKKSHVSLEQRVCVVCGTTFDTGSLLLDKRLRASMERHTTIGLGPYAPSTSGCSTKAMSRWSSAIRSTVVRRRRATS